MLETVTIIFHEVHVVWEIFQDMNLSGGSCLHGRFQSHNVERQRRPEKMEHQVGCLGGRGWVFPLLTPDLYPTRETSRTNFLNLKGTNGTSVPVPALFLLKTHPACSAVECAAGPHKHFPFPSCLSGRFCQQRGLCLTKLESHWQGRDLPPKIQHV